MNLTTYFIKHPVIAIVLNAMIIIVGILCFSNLSVREYPDVTFPSVSVRTLFANASAELVETSVTNVLEDQLAGIEGIETIKSDSKYGQSEITIIFRNGTSIDRAMLAIREAIGLAKDSLPEEISEPIVERINGEFSVPFVVLSLESTSMGFAELTHFANLGLKNSFRSIKGVASAEVWGQPYTYQISLSPHKMFTFGVNATDVFEALKLGNLSLPVGKFRDEIPSTLNNELKNTDDYKNLLVKEKNFSIPNHKQHPVFLKDIADVSLETDNKKFRVRINGRPGLCVAIQKAKDANPLEVSALVQEQLTTLQKTLPDGVKVEMIIDQADFIRQSLKNIKSSVFEAILLVLAIVFLFLRNIKATLIPLVTIPISLIGSMLFLKVFGFSINILTLMAIVLAVGLVVDDAIIVLENIQRYIEEGIAPKEAAIKGAKEIGFAIVAMTLTLTSVYIPLVFISGTTGQLFTEFAVALAGSVLISGIVALTLSPLMCASTLGKNQSHIWPQIDDLLEKISIHYHRILKKVITHKTACLCILITAFASTYIFIKIVPTELAPKEDCSLIGVYLPPIPGKDINTMEEKIKTIEQMVKSTPEAQSILIFAGDWGGSVAMPLVPQTSRSRSATEILESITPHVKSMPSVEVYPWNWESGLPGNDDTATHVELSTVISTTDDYRKLLDNVDKARKTIEEGGLFTSIGHNLKLDTAGLRIDLNSNEISQLNLSSKQIAKTIEIFFSGDSSLNFSKDGIRYKLNIKADREPWTLDELYISNPQGKRISLGAVAKIVPTTQADSLFHYNQMRSVIMTANLSPSQKVNSLMSAFQNVLDKELPKSYKKNWTGAAKAYTDSQSTMATLFLLAIIFIYAILAAQFENFIDPLIVLLTVPFACFGALLLTWIFGQSLNIYTQVGLITLIGLITKHGILIVEFANQLQTQNITLTKAIIKSASLRLRPILMTTCAMIFGAIPLIISHDAGYESRKAIGIVLIGGLGFGTFFTLFILPSLYLVIKSLEQYYMNLWKEKCNTK